MKELTLTGLSIIVGCDAAAAERYLDELCKKYGVTNKFDALQRATLEELMHHVDLFYS